LVELITFSEAQTAPADGDCFPASGGENGTGVAVEYCHLSRIRFSALRLETKDFGMEATPERAPSYRPEVVIPGACRL
jgi:hypothetical protein